MPNAVTPPGCRLSRTNGSHSETARESEGKTLILPSPCPTKNSSPVTSKLQAFATVCSCLEAQGDLGFPGKESDVAPSDVEILVALSKLVSLAVVLMFELPAVMSLFSDPFPFVPEVLLFSGLPKALGEERGAGHDRSCPTLC